MLLQLSHFSVCHTTPPLQLPQVSPTSLSMSVSHAYMFFGYSILYAILCIPIFCNYQFVHLNPLTFFSHPSIHPPPTPHLATIKTFCIYDSVSVLLVCLFCCLDSIVDKYVFIAILSFIFWFFLTFHIILIW